ncbi:MAG: heavy metal-associated domain-containing protein [Bacteroidota bacterium]
MMRAIVVMAIMIASSQVGWSQKAPIEIAGGYQVEIMTSAICELCKETIERELTFTKGVKESDLNVESRVVTVKYNPKKTSPKEIRRHIAGVGYHADNVDRDATAYEKLPFCCKDGSHGREILDRSH